MTMYSPTHTLLWLLGVRKEYRHQTQVHAGYPAHLIPLTEDGILRTPTTYDHNVVV